MLDFPDISKPVQPPFLQIMLRPDTLRAAWEAMRRNGGGPGGDGITISRFARNADDRLERLRDEVMDASYMPGPARRVEIPKKRGGHRTLTIPCLRDRVLQKAMALTLSDAFEAEFEDCSFAYRPGRSVEMAARAVVRLARAGYLWAVDADIRAFFDEVPHGPLLQQFHAQFGERRLTELVAQWLDGGDGVEAMSGRSRGLPQGGPISPHLANLYLDTLDEQLIAEGARLVRYADDFVILTRSRAEARRLLTLGEEKLAALGLVLHPEKTEVRSFDEGFDFLGRRFATAHLIDDEDGLDAEERAALESLWRRETDQSPAPQARLLGTWLEPPEAPFEEAFVPEIGRDGARILHVLTPGHVVDAREGALAVRSAGSEIWTRTAVGLDRVEIGPDVDVTDRAVRLLAAGGVPAFWVGPGGEMLAEAAPAIPDRASLHLAQARFCLDEAAALEFSRQIAHARIKSAHNVMMGWKVDVSRRARGTGARAERFAHFLESVETARKPMRRAMTNCLTAPEKNALLGLEGEAMRQWWRVFRRAIAPLSMGPRTRPAQDLPNAVLNYLSALLTRDMVGALRAQGLHPGFGVYHATGDRRHALAYDLVESFRGPIVGSLARTLINRRQITADDGLVLDGECRLSRQAANALISSYHQFVSKQSKGNEQNRRSFRDLFTSQAVDLRRSFLGSTEFAPWVPDY